MDSRYIRRLWQYAETAASLTVQPGGAEGVRDRRRAVPDKESALKQESQPLCYRTRVAFDRCGLQPVDQRSSRSEERRVGKEWSVRVDLGGRRIIKKKKTLNKKTRNQYTHNTKLNVNIKQKTHKI